MNIQVENSDIMISKHDVMHATSMTELATSKVTAYMVMMMMIHLPQ